MKQGDNEFNLFSLKCLNQTFSFVGSCALLEAGGVIHYLVCQNQSFHFFSSTSVTLQRFSQRSGLGPHPGLSNSCGSGLTKLKWIKLIDEGVLFNMNVCECFWSFSLLVSFSGHLGCEVVAEASTVFLLCEAGLFSSGCSVQTAKHAKVMCCVFEKLFLFTIVSSTFPVLPTRRHVIGPLTCLTSETYTCVCL